MIHKIVFLTFAIFGLVSTSGATSGARSPSAPPVETIYKVDGLRAEFLFNAMNKFERVEGLAGTAECSMGTCTTKMKFVQCTKSMEDGPSEIFVGDWNVPYLTCSMLSTNPAGVFKNVSLHVNDGVGELRRALVEITGKEWIVENAKSVTVKSIDCTARGVGREMNSLETETTFDCTIVR